MNSRIRTLFYILLLNPDYAAARSLRSITVFWDLQLEFLDVFIYLIQQFFVLSCRPERFVVTSAAWFTLCLRKEQNTNWHFDNIWQLTFKISLTRPTMVKDFPVPGGPCTRQIRGIGKGLCTAFAAVEMTFSCDSLYSCKLNIGTNGTRSTH